MNQHRVAPANPKTRKPVARAATPASSGWLVVTMLCFCAAASFLMWWGSQADIPSSPQVVERAPTSTEASLSVPTVPVPSVQSPSGYNSDPIGTLTLVLAQQGDGIALIGGAVLGGMVLAMVAAWRVTRIPKDPLATGLGRTLTLLENNHRAGTLTPVRALEVARIAVAEHEQAHSEAIRTRTATYNEAIAQLTKAHQETIAAIRKEVTTAVQNARQETNMAITREENALQRVAYTEAQVQQLSHDLALAHQQGVEANTLIRTQAAEISDLTQGLDEATTTLVQWQEAHRDLADRYTVLVEQHTQMQTSLAEAQTTAATATQRCEVVEMELQSLRTQQETFTQAQTLLTEQLTEANKELTRLQGISLKELAIVIPDRERDLIPHMARLVEFIRGTTMDTGGAGGERTNKPVLSSWRDVRRLFQVLKGVGVRFAVPAHHVPQWALATLPVQNQDPVLPTPIVPLKDEVESEAAHSVADVPVPVDSASL